jgi:hypothetical protein
LSLIALELETKRPQVHHLDAIAQRAEPTHEVYSLAVGCPWRHRSSKLTRCVEQLVEPTLDTRSDFPCNAVSEVLLADQEWILGRGRDAESELTSLGYRLDCPRLIQAHGNVVIWLRIDYARPDEFSGSTRNAG